MAFYPATCDRKCVGCEKNSGGWCVWRDRDVSSNNSVESAIMAVCDNKEERVNTIKEIADFLNNDIPNTPYDSYQERLEYLGY